MNPKFIVKVLEVIETQLPFTPEKIKYLIERFQFWKAESIEDGYEVDKIFETDRNLKIRTTYIVVKKTRKIRSDAGKERVNRTGFNRPGLPRNLDKIPKHNKK